MCVCGPTNGTERARRVSGRVARSFLSRRLAPELAEELSAYAAKRSEGDLAAALQPWMAKHQLTWPLPSDALNAPHPEKLAAGNMRGFILADVVFQPTTAATPAADAAADDADAPAAAAPEPTRWSFAREIDRRTAARWDHDWKLVDVDGLVAGEDWRNLPLILTAKTTN